MSGATTTGDLEFAVEAAWRAGRATLAHYQTGVASEAKADDSPVTAADRASERLIRTLISARYPDDAVLGEEDGETRTGAARRWIIDPIDGTRTFVRGVPFYGVLLALEVDGHAELGVMHFPALDETIYAARGQGCFWNGRRCRVSDVASISDALILTTDVRNIETFGRSGWPELEKRAGIARTWGDCYGYALVATGRAEVMCDPALSLWDIAAVQPIIEEAGGVVTPWGDVSGEAVPLDAFTSAVATNRVLADDVRNTLGGRAR